jgi:hypothetical protein
MSYSGPDSEFEGTSWESEAEGFTLPKVSFEQIRAERDPQVPSGLAFIAFQELDGGMIEVAAIGNLSTFDESRSPRYDIDAMFAAFQGETQRKFPGFQVERMMVRDEAFTLLHTVHEQDVSFLFGRDVYRFSN